MGGKGTPSIKIETDPTTNCMRFVSYPHSEIHGASHYFHEDYIILASGGIHVIEITTADTTKWMHFLGAITTSAGTIIQLIEGPTAGVGGTVRTPFNNNRNSPNQSVHSLKTGVSQGAGGLVLMNRHVGSGSNPSNASAGEASRDNEIIFRQNTIYQIVITSEAAGNYVDWAFSWYEHTNKNQ